MTQCTEERCDPRVVTKESCWKWEPLDSSVRCAGHYAMACAMPNMPAPRSRGIFNRSYCHPPQQSKKVMPCEGEGRSLGRRVAFRVATRRTCFSL